MFEEKEYLTQSTLSFSLHHAVFAILFIVLGSVYFNLVVLSAHPYYSVTAFTFIYFALGFLYFFLQGKKLTKISYFILISTLIFSLRPFFVKFSDTIDTLWFLVLHLSALLFVLAVYIEDFTDDFLKSIVQSFINPFKSFLMLPVAVITCLSETKSTSESKGGRTKHIFLGIIIGFVVIGVIFSLMMSDMFFSSFASGFCRSFKNLLANFDILNYINFITVLVSLYLFGAFYQSERECDEEMPAKIHIPSSVSSTVAVMLIAFYILFFISQLVGVIKCFAGTLPEGETYSSFARSGFFNLCIVACINGIIIYLSNKFHPNKAYNKLTKFLSLILSVCTLLIIGTAFSKMIIYIYVFGFTPKRFYTIWFMVLLSITFVLSIVKFKKDILPLSRIMIYTTYIMLLILFFIDFSALSAYLNK